MTRRLRSEPRGGYVVAQEADLSGVRRRVRAELRDCGAPASASFDCLVAITEACTNALLHGRSAGDGTPAQVTWTIDSHAARFLVRDFSTRRWSIAAHPSAGPSWLEDADVKKRVGGFGIELMRRLMDEADISIQPHGTTVRLVKLFSPATS